MRKQGIKWSALLLLTAAMMFGACGSEDTDDNGDPQDTTLEQDTSGEEDLMAEDNTEPETTKDVIAQDNAVEDIPEEEAYVPPVDNYPEGPYGKIVGTIIKNHVFLNPESGKSMKFATMYQHPKKRVLLINSSAGWCTYCKQEAYELREVYSEFGPKGLEIWFTLFQDYQGGPATVDFWNQWMDTISPTYPTLLDTAFEMGSYFNVDATPMNMVIDLDTMEIVYLQTGYDKVGLFNKLESLLQ